MGSRTAALLFVAALGCFDAYSAQAWGNRISHQDLFDESLEGQPATDTLERLMREDLGFSQGAQTRLAVQLGFDDAIDGDIAPAGG